MLGGTVLRMAAAAVIAAAAVVLLGVSHQQTRLATEQALAAARLQRNSMARSALDIYAPTETAHTASSAPLDPNAAITATIVVPAFREQANVRPLTERLFAALRDPTTVELVIVDDNSRDGTVEAVDALRNAGYNVRIVVRTVERGLSSAVLAGFAVARGSRLVCMDADLQHPPERVQALLDALDNADFVIGTRYGPGVEVNKSWPIYRRIISAGARMLALPLATVSDPMTGFFAVRRDVAARASAVNRSGFKIALDLLIKASVKTSRIAEVPYSFGVRTVGESKLTGKVIFYYVLQLLELYVFKFGAFSCLAVLIGCAVVAVGGLELILNSPTRTLHTASKRAKKAR